MTSLADAQPCKWPVSLTPISLGWRTSQGKPRHDFAGIGTADPDRQHAQPAAVRGVRVGADDQAAGKGVILQDDLMNDAGARLPEADPVLLRGRSQKIVDLFVLVDRAVDVFLGARLCARMR